MIHSVLQRLCLAAILLFAVPGAIAVARVNPAQLKPSVVVQTVTDEVIDPPVTRIGRVEALKAVDLRARVPGFVERIAFAPGAAVKEGDLLIEIEPAVYEAAVAAAKAQVARAEATRRQASDARDRTAELVRRNAAARATLDEQQAAFDVAEADLAVARATLLKAELDLSYTRIAAPISGRIGQPKFTEGNFVGPDSGTIARLVQLDPIRVVFSVSEGEIVTFRQTEIESGKTMGKNIRIGLTLPNGEPYGLQGQLEFMGPEVDARTGTAAVRAVFPNPDGLLMPGQFVNAVLDRAPPRKGLVVPQSAVLQDRDGRFVYVVDAANVAHQQRIEVGAKLGENWAITKGLIAGDKVVVQGTQRLSDGAVVQPVGTGDAAQP